ncbi:MAG: type VI secretion system baseplate subunit TssG [Gemmatimonadaceae bacterium]
MAPTGPLAALLSGGDDGRGGFQFLQAMRLLEQHFPGGLAPRGIRPGAPRISVRPHEGLGFPAADVRSVEARDGGEPGAQLVVTFLGLYGVDSPLPSYFGKVALGDAHDDGRGVRDFLDIFGNRIYALLYEALRKYRPSLAASEAARGTDAERALCLAGLGAPGPAGTGSRESLLPFAAVLRNAVRNVDGLTRLVATLIPAIAVRVQENMPRWIEAPTRPQLGQRGERAVLGVTTWIGRRLLDASGSFRIVLGPMTWEQFEQLRPGKRDAQALHELVTLYAPDGLAYDVELLIHSSRLPMTRLGSPTNRIGRTTWVGRAHDTMVSEVVAYA